MGRVFRAGLRAEALASDLRLTPGSATVGLGTGTGSGWSLTFTVAGVGTARRGPRAARWS